MGSGLWADDPRSLQEWPYRAVPDDGSDGRPVGRRMDVEGGAMAEYPAGIGHRRRHSGVSHWRWQRYSAVLVLALMTYFTVLLASLGGLDHDGATALVGHPANALALAVLVTVGLWHGTLGLQVVIEDYITIKGGRQMALMAMRAAMAIIGLATLWAVSRIAL
ncbi:MAG: succinate dehydrogenase, hydrophobic membrane anchor protein [SAR116 cluster bacterium]|nr:succinate dehydrogenase, hydrophobic membrane anchor protein [SAR116 cluster bacterium]NBR03993.1 succinate dehydrogenase, hydrophobic membrane anchor protein [Alphaproteobacteria bacterium]